MFGATQVSKFVTQAPNRVLVSLPFGCRLLPGTMSGVAALSYFQNQRARQVKRVGRCPGLLPCSLPGLPTFPVLSSDPEAGLCFLSAVNTLPSRNVQTSTALEFTNALW